MDDDREAMLGRYSKDGHADCTAAESSVVEVAVLTVFGSGGKRRSDIR